MEGEKWMKQFRWREVDGERSIERADGERSMKV
jgi:hypothetical protein